MERQARLVGRASYSASNEARERLREDEEEVAEGEEDEQDVKGSKIA
jgi:hypothetical protein